MRGKLIVLALATATTIAGITYHGQPGTALVVEHEAIVNQAYPDPAHGWAVPTICVGHTLTARRGMWLSDEQCLDLLEQDLNASLDHLRGMLGPQAALTEGETLAYSSFVFNVGPTKLRGSTWLKKLRAGDRTGACHELRRWVYSNGKKLRGLVRRRAAEEEVCLRDL